MKESVSSFKKKLDKVFSDFIRQRDKGVCFTCGTRKPWKEMQNGHFISRSHNAMRFDERNCNCQCVGCNVFKSGNMPAYAINLQSKYGNEILKTLYKAGQKVKQFSVPELKKMIQKYKDKALENRADAIKWLESCFGKRDPKAKKEKAKKEEAKVVVKEEGDEG